MSKLENAIDTIIEVFESYSSKEGDKFTLSRRELQSLLRGELSQYLQASRDPQRVKEIMSGLDKNMDGKVTFEEFVALLAQLTVYTTKFFYGYTPVGMMCGQMKDGQFQPF